MMGNVRTIMGSSKQPMRFKKNLAKANKQHSRADNFSWLFSFPFLLHLIPRLSLYDCFCPLSPNDAKQAKLIASSLSVHANDAKQAKQIASSLSFHANNAKQAKQTASSLSVHANDAKQAKQNASTLSVHAINVKPAKLITLV